MYSPNSFRNFARGWKKNIDVRHTKFFNNNLSIQFVDEKNPNRCAKS